MVLWTLTKVSTNSISLCLFQIILSRLQKEKDTFQEDCEKLQERLELQQNQLSKAQRDRDNMLTELEVFKERWEKTTQSQQKFQVRNCSQEIFRAVCLKRHK